MNRLVVFGTQWGDEGKGKITDFLATKADAIVRYQGGNNAGHTVVIEDKKYSLHLLPSGILNEEKMNILANGMVINVEELIKEIETLEVNNFRLFISDRAHVTFNFHLEQDLLEENFKTLKIGTTKKGIGPTYKDKSSRVGIRIGTLISSSFKKEFKRLVDYKNVELSKTGMGNIDYELLIPKYIKYGEMIKKYVTDTSLLINEEIKKDKKILFEGAQGVLLCLEHGTYPYVTSSSPTSSSVPVNVGIAPWLIDGAIGVVKAYTTRVGEGPLPTEINNDLANYIRKKGKEFGTTTGRPRRIGWLDLVVVNYSKRVSGLSYLSLTLLDVLTGLDSIKIAVSYNLDGQTIYNIPSDIDEYSRCIPNYIEVPGWKEDITNIKKYVDLPFNVKNYIRVIEEITEIKVSCFSVGPRRDQTIEIIDVFGDKND